MRERSSQLVLLAFVLVFMAWILCAGLVVSAQNTNSSTTMVPETSKPKPKHRKAAAQTTGRCDPMQQEQTDLSGTYTGKATHSDGSVSNDVTLTVTGNNFTLTGGPEAMSGRITAVTTCGYTAVTMMFGDMTPPAAVAMAAAHTAVSLRAKKVGDRLTLTSVTGEPRKVSFVSAGAAAKAPRKHRRKARDGGGTEESVEFPWPPPRASASVTIPYEFLKKPDGQTNLRDVSGRLTRVLNQAGYEEMSWYEVPSGFALVSRFEQCDADGTPLNGAARFILKIFNPPPSGPLDYLKKLIFAQPGHFRVIVFIVTNQPFGQSKVTVSRDEAIDWLSSGTNGLPNGIGDMQFTSAYLTTALIYEFEQASADSAAILTQPSSLTGKMHLQKSGIWAALERP